MSLVRAKEVATVLGLQSTGIVGQFLGWLVLHLTRISRVNRFYDKHKHLEGLAFLDSVIDDLDLQFELPVEDIKKIPLNGPFVCVSNHPLGGVDGLILMKIMLKIRPDFKLMANFLLARVTPLSPYILAVNPFENHSDVQSSFSGFKGALSHLKQGGCLGVFPAGEVATQKSEERYVDKAWEAPVMKLIKRAEVPVIPVYFHAKNSLFFYRISRLGSAFRTAFLASELFNQYLRKIKVRVGKPIPVQQQQACESLDSYTHFLRKKTYMLSKALRKERFKIVLPRQIKVPSLPKRIAKALSPELLQAEIEGLQKNNRSLLKYNQYEVFLAQSKEMNYLLQEIGRQREITFRAIGEGTNKSLDLDVFDTYYHHLFLWDNDAKKIVGAYRMGLGNIIFEKYGIEGFYLHQLFRFEPEMEAVMKKTIEMGRAFIVSDYQQKPMPLFLLWKGIIHTTLRHPEHQYLMGGVSISNQFSNFSKSLMIEFMKSNYWDPYLAQYVHPKKEFKVKIDDADREFVFDETQADLNKFDRLIAEVEPGQLRLPVLIKKYIKQNARVISFNVDPLFNYAIDGLMYIKISDIPESTMKPVLEEFQEQLESGLTP